MAKPELGVKRRCQSCSAAFYDLNREPIVCPKCGTEFVMEQPKPVRKKREPEPAAPAVGEEIEVEEAIDTDVDDFLEEDLDEDTDVGEVIDAADDEEET